jgi:bifunctional non-homologous end joining protein LigD
MLATLVDEPFDDEKWVFETKWDGVRLVTEQRASSVTLWSRNGINVTAKYAVALAVSDKVRKQWVYAGHVGTGFNAAALKSL